MYPRRTSKNEYKGEYIHLYVTFTAFLQMTSRQNASTKKENQTKRNKKKKNRDQRQQQPRAKRHCSDAKYEQQQQQQLEHPVRMVPMSGAPASAQRTGTMMREELTPHAIVVEARQTLLRWLPADLIDGVSVMLLRFPYHDPPSASASIRMNPCQPTFCAIRAIAGNWGSESIAPLAGLPLRHLPISLKHRPTW